eukprot:scaffold64406_cov53-Attheya_sp.AAC.3
MPLSMASCWTCSMLESVLKYEVKNQKECNSDNKYLAIGKAFALSLLPFWPPKIPTQPPIFKTIRLVLCLRSGRS